MNSTSPDSEDGNSSDGSPGRPKEDGGLPQAQRFRPAPAGGDASAGMTVLASSMSRELVRLRANLLAMRAERDAAEQRYQGIKSSTIWRMTSPIRRGLEWLSKARAGSRPASSAVPCSEPMDSPASDVSALKDAYRDQCIRDLDSFLAAGERLSFPSPPRPRVSILIVLFNQAELTLACLRSLSQGACPEDEVIIVDNNSTDRTGTLLARLDGVRVVRAPENLHFLRGVNRAARDARGRYLLLLNNDTHVECGAISAAAVRLDSEPDLGAVGGPVLKLDGTLQEAGCIVWSNGHTEGYGRGGDPGSWEFQFQRDVDYCSGAFLMVRRDLFEQLGGLDTAYSPAYFEETDLCMRIREAGFRVGYEPAARILHYEYGSATSSLEAVELYTRNRERFLSRHATALAVSHHAPGSSVLLARMRNGAAGRVMLVDPRVWDARASSREAFLRKLITMMQGAEFAVTYCAPASISDKSENGRTVMSAQIECPNVDNEDAMLSLLQERKDYYDIVLLLGPARSALTIIRETGDTIGLVCLPCWDLRRPMESPNRELVADLE